MDQAVVKRNSDKAIFLCRQFQFISSSFSSQKEKSHPISSHYPIMPHKHWHNFFVGSVKQLALTDLISEQNWKNTSLEQLCKAVSYCICECISVYVYILFRGFLFFYQNVHMTCNIIYKQCSQYIYFYTYIFSTKFEHLKDTLKYEICFMVD